MIKTNTTIKIYQNDEQQFTLGRLDGAFCSTNKLEIFCSYRIKICYITYIHKQLYNVHYLMCLYNNRDDLSYQNLTKKRL